MKKLLQSRKFWNVFGITLAAASSVVVYMLGEAMGEWTAWEETKNIVNKLVEEATDEVIG